MKTIQIVCNYCLPLQIPLDDSDYDTADIINISKELYRSTSLEESKANTANVDSGSMRKESFNIREILPPPPDHLLAESSNSSTPEHEHKEYLSASQVAEKEDNLWDSNTAVASRDSSKPQESDSR